MKWSDNKQLASYIFACCIAVVPSLSLIPAFVVQNLLTVFLCQLTSTEEVSSWEYCFTRHKLRNLWRNSGRWSRGTIIQTGITCKKTPCYMCNPACRWFIVKKSKKFWSFVNFFEFLQVWENIKSWLVYANKFFWIVLPYFSTDIIKRSQCQLLFLGLKTFNEKKSFL